MWLPTLARLLGLDAPPLHVLSRDEAAGEELFLRDAFHSQLLVPSQINPFAHVTPQAAIATAAGSAGEAAAARGAAASVADRGGGRRVSRAPPPPPGARREREHERSNTWVKWVRGSALVAAGESDDAIERARGILGRVAVPGRWSVVDPPSARTAVDAAEPSDVGAGPRRHLLVAFLGVHVDSPGTLSALRYSLASVSNQTYGAGLRVSWSAADAKLEAATRKELDEFERRAAAAAGTRGAPTRCLHQPSALPTFEHYRCLARDLVATEGGGRRGGSSSGGGGTTESICFWVVFGEPGGVWHPLRTQFLCMLLSSADAATRRTSEALTCPWYVGRTGSDKGGGVATTTTDQAPRSFEEAELQMRSGRLKLANLTDARGSRRRRRWRRRRAVLVRVLQAQPRRRFLRMGAGGAAGPRHGGSVRRHVCSLSRAGPRRGGTR